MHIFAGTSDDDSHWCVLQTQIKDKLGALEAKARLLQKTGQRRQAAEAYR